MLVEEGCLPLNVRFQLNVVDGEEEVAAPVGQWDDPTTHYRLLDEININAGDVSIPSPPANYVSPSDEDIGDEVAYFEVFIPERVRRHLLTAQGGE